jgi:hypothetical protein
MRTPEACHDILVFFWWSPVCIWGHAHKGAGRETSFQIFIFYAPSAGVDHHQPAREVIERGVIANVIGLPAVAFSRERSGIETNDAFQASGSPVSHRSRSLRS